jgi:threonine aldolase
VLSETELRSLQRSCDRSVSGHGPVRVSRLLASIPADTDIDMYGAGGVVTALENETADLLGKPAAVFLPSGTMAQQLALRVHADRRSRRGVVFHPMCHLRHHEGEALERVQGLVGRPVGHPERLLTVDQLSTVAEPPASLLIELPQRDLGGQQPDWDDLQSQLAWARERQAATHLDGARLWESAAGYGRTPAEISHGFDSVYVSFYKGVGALPGCCLAGDEDLVAQVREWRQRMGGTLYGMWPAAASARTLLAQRLPLMPAYFERTLAIATALEGHDQITVLPDPPQTPMLHLLLAVGAERLQHNAVDLARDASLWTWGKGMPTGNPVVQRVELSVGDATCELTIPEIVAAIDTVVAAA